MDTTIELRNLIRDVGIYNSLPKEHKQIVFGTWNQYDDYKGIHKMFSIFNDNKINNLMRCIKKMLDDHKSHDLILESFDRYNTITKFILDHYDENEINGNKNDLDKCVENKNNTKKFIWRDNQINGWQTSVDSNFVNGIHSQATGSGKSLIALKTINEYNKKYPKDHILWICERKDIPRKLFFSGDKNNNGIHHKENFKFWKDNDIIDMSKFHIVEHIYNKNKTWTKKLNDYEGDKPIFLIINRAFMTSSSKIQGKNYRYEEIRKFPKFAIIDECHSSMANETYQLLLYLKFNKEVKIHGLSATPYRSGKSNTDLSIDIDCDATLDINTKENEKKLLRVFCKPGDINQLNILSFFNLKDAIEAGVILEPIFHWYTIQSNNEDVQNNSFNQKDINSVLCVLDTILGKCEYRKCIVWCGTIQLADEWHDIFGKNKHNRGYRNLQNIKEYKDHSKNKNNDYDEFYDLNDNSILFCANKFREGSDIPYLSCCMFLDKVVNRGAIPFIQCIGRVLRKDVENHKKNGHILDGCINHGDTPKVKSIVNKILGYYVRLYEISRSRFMFNTDDVKMSDDKIDLFNQIIQSIVVIPQKKKIIIKLKNDKTMEIDATRLDLSSLEWDKLIPKFTKALKKMIVMSDYEEYIALRDYCIKIGIKDKYDYTKKYTQYPNFYNIDENGDKIILDPKKRFPTYFKSWYDFLKIDDGNFIKSLNEWRKLCKSRGIVNAAQYMKLCEKDQRFPDMPEEIYDEFSNIPNELNFIKNNKRR